MEKYQLLCSRVRSEPESGNRDETRPVVGSLSALYRLFDRRLFQV